MNTVVMVTRVSLLLLVTGLFAVMWSADCPDERTVSQLQMARLASSPSMFAGPIAPGRQEVASADAQVQSIPLPNGIAPGTYLVVNQVGLTQRVTIAADAENASNSMSRIDQYAVRIGDARWHFIRIEPTVTQSLSRRIPATQATRR